MMVEYLVKMFVVVGVECIWGVMGDSLNGLLFSLS